MTNLDVLKLQLTEIPSLPHSFGQLKPTTSGKGRNYLSREQQQLVDSRFRKGVELSDFVPTFMACERLYIQEEGEEESHEEGGTSTPSSVQERKELSKKRYYNGSALSRRRAEWHGDETTKGTDRKDPNNLLHLEDGNNDKNSFVPWRALFTDGSLRPEHLCEWKSTIVASSESLLRDEGNGQHLGTTADRCSDQTCDGKNSYYATFVLEYAPTGALLEARFRIVSDGEEDNEQENVFAGSNEQQERQRPGNQRKIVSNEYRILNNEVEIREWWEVHRRFSSHEQFFPRGLRFGKKLPPTLHEDGWETKMQRVYGTS